LNLLSIYDILVHRSCEILIEKAGLDQPKENIAVTAQTNRKEESGSVLTGVRQ
jgi:hypothetical protein